MYSQIGARAYQQIGLESAVMSANPHQLVTMLFDGALSALSVPGFSSTRIVLPKKVKHCRKQ